MSNTIVENGRRILRISNRALYALEKKMINISEQKKINDPFLFNFLEEMDQDNFGCGMIYKDINKFNYHPDSLKIFIHLVKEANRKLSEEHYFDQSVKERMDPFILELEAYYDKIKE